MIDEVTAVERSLDWAMTIAQGCQETYVDRLCAGCTLQGRKRCALAEYADRLIAQRYSARWDDPYASDAAQ